MSLIHGTIGQAIEVLAQRALTLSTRPPTYQEKTAEGMSDLLSGLGRHAQANPELAHALLGGAAGAGLGSVGAMVGNRYKDKEGRRGILRSALTGGLAGAAVGGGVGLARRGIANLGAPSTASAQAQALADRVAELRAPAPVHEQIAVRGLRGLGDAFVNSWSPRIVAGVGAVDTALHSGLNLGNRTFSWLGNRGLGSAAPEFSTDVNHLVTGLKSKNIGELPPAIQDALRKYTKNTVIGRQPGLPTSLSGMIGPTPVEGANVPGAATQGPDPRGKFQRIIDWWKNRPGPGRPPTTNTVTDLLAAAPRHGPASTNVLDVHHRPDIPGTQTVGGVTTPFPQQGPMERASMNRGELRGVAREGALADPTMKSGDKGIRGLMRFGKSTYRMPSMRYQVGGRVLGYGMIPIAEMAIRGLMREHSNENELRSIMNDPANAATGRRGS